MPTYQIVSLVDITRTNPARDETDSFRLSQQANFNSLIQAIGLRSNIEWEHDPVKQEGSLPEPFDGKAAYWTWTFFVERDEVFVRDNNPVGLLLDDLHNVPIIDNLEETVDLQPAVFQTQGHRINIWVFEL